MSGQRFWKGAAAVLAMLAVGAFAADNVRTVALYDVRRTSSPPVIDGRLDDACWQGQPVITNMVLRDAKGRVPARVQTRTTILYDDEALYVGIHLDEPNPAGLRMNYRQYDGQLWWDDSVELYLETGATHARYFKLMSNPLGTRFDVQGKWTPMGFQFFDWGTGAAWTVQPHVGEDYWSLEFRLPWDDLECHPPAPGDLWSFEIVRFRYAGGDGGKEYSAWNVGVSYRNPERFGNIVFSGTTAELEKMLVDQLQPVFGGNLKIYGRQGEIRYVDYGESKALLVARARDEQRALATRLEALRSWLASAESQELDQRLAAYEHRLAELAESAPGAAVSEALDTLLAGAGKIAWALKYHELNASLPSSGTGMDPSVNR